MAKLELINKLAMEIVNDETESYRLADMNAQRIVILAQPFQFNEDQQIVFEYLKAFDGNTGSLVTSIYSLYCLGEMTIDSIDLVEIGKVKEAFMGLSRKQEAEVLQAFAEWGLSDEST